MTKTRLEAFSDGVIAIIITIMVLELKVPHDPTMEGLYPLLPVFLSYILSFINVGIYWANHHHLLHTVGKVNGGTIWANMHLLFWLSIMPFATAWMGENHFETLPVAFYGVDLLLCGVAYYILQITIARHNSMNDSLKVAMKKQSRKGIISLVIYSIAVPAAFYNPLISATAYTCSAIMWLIPDRNIENALKD